MSAIPFNPEPLTVLQARYPAALEPVYDARAIIGGAIRPGEVAANVFHFEDGLTLIVSRDRLHSDGEINLHFSASFPGECRIADEFRLLKITMSTRQIMDKWIASVPGRFAELSGDNRPVTFLGITPHGIPHWIIEGVAK